MADFNLIDRFVGYVNPVAGAKRASARVALDLQRSYQAAAVTDRTSNWTSAGGGANFEMKGGLPVIRARSRQLVRDNPYAARMMQIYSANVVGAGIMPQFSSDNEKQALLAEEMWNDWAGSTECDAEGRHDFYGLQRLLMRTVPESGSTLIRKRPRRASDKLTVPMQVQFLEPDHLDTGKGVIEGKSIIGGVEFSKTGKRKGYWLFPEHPGEPGSFLSSYDNSKFIRARDIVHVYRVDRPGAVDGVPWLAPVMHRLHDFDEVEDAVLLRQKLANCYTTFVTDLQAEPIANANPDPISLSPGTSLNLPPGKDVKFATPPPATGYGEYTTVVLHAIATGAGMTYEALTGDLSRVNYSSARMGWLEFQRNIVTWRSLVMDANKQIWQWFVESAALMGHDFSDVKVTWTPPHREMVDLRTETKALIDKARAGIISMPTIHRGNGDNSADVLAEIAAWNKALDEAEVELTSDPRTPAKP